MPDKHAQALKPNAKTVDTTHKAAPDLPGEISSEDLSTQIPDRRAALRPGQVLALNRQIGNQATQRVLTQQKTSSPTIQRRITAVTINNVSGLITSVAFRSGNTGRTGTHRGGQHTTAYVTFVTMIRNNLMGQTRLGALNALRNLAEDIKGMPTQQSTNTNPSMFNYIATLLFDIANAHAAELMNPNVTTRQEILALANRVIYARNSLDRASYNTPNPTHSGVTEATEAGNLTQVDDMIRNGQVLPPTTTFNSLIPTMWNLFHFDPSGNPSDNELAAQIIQHAYSMWMTYPNIMQHFGGNATLILQQGVAQNVIANRVVNAGNYNWVTVNQKINRYDTHNEIPQYRAQPNADYDNYLQGQGFSLA